MYSLKSCAYKFSFAFLKQFLRFYFLRKLFLCSRGPSKFQALANSLTPGKLCKLDFGSGFKVVVLLGCS